jgi:hypothetical protein
MKTTKIFSLLLLSVFISMCGINTKAQTSMVTGGNVIKTNLSSIAIAHYQLQYERVTGPFTSFAIGMGYSPNVPLPFASSLSDNFDGDDEVAAINSMRFSKFTLTPEYRFYAGKKGAPGGFYLATFLRYTNMSTENVYPFVTDSLIPHEMEVKGKFSGVGAGAMIGIQWLLGNYITIDWWIVGPFIGVMNSSFDGVDNHPWDKLSAQEEADLQTDINNVDLPLWTVDAKVQDMKADVKLKGPFYGVRFMGVSAGFRF